MLTREDDNDGDGIIDVFITVNYDSYGNMLGYTAIFPETNIENYYVAVYDEDGNLTSESYDYNGDGIADETTTYTYEYDEDGNLTSYTSVADYDGDGVQDNVEIYNYDSYGSLIYEGYDYDGDGVIDEEYEYATNCE